MRILMVSEGGFVKNPFVPSLADGLIRCGHEIAFGLDRFWDSFDAYDLLYFQWPEAIFDWRREGIDLNRLSSHFNRIKDSGVRTVITCHNLHPHNNDTKTMALYDLVYSNVDAFHHMGRYSYGLFRDKYPDSIHFIAPHHVADSFWTKTVSSHEAKRALKIPMDSVVVSSFGEFRNSEEVWLFVKMAKDVFSRDTSFLAPRIPRGSCPNSFNLGKALKLLLRNLVYKSLRIRPSGFLSDDELRVWLSASDVVFIQRKEILNSGNLPLAYAAGKVVVGPDRGNVGEILKKTGNYVFEPNDRTSVRQSVLDAIGEIRNGNRLGALNEKYAKDNWAAARVCGLIDKELSMIVTSR